jgi:hypothetical protein
MEAKKYYPVNEMLNMCGLNPKVELDLFLRIVLSDVGVTRKVGCVSSRSEPYSRCMWGGEWL